MLDDYIDKNQKDCIGVVGYSFALSSLALLLRESSRDAAGIDLQAGVLLDEGGTPLKDGFKFPLYDDVQSMLKEHPEISMVFELSGDHEMVGRLRTSLPVEIALVELPAARFFCAFMPLTVYG